ncbi:MAG: uracil-DNA glycosylase [Candidatus Cloacimonadaceae bacterium]|jgi:uracil-DNA glycosylase family 4|nr:uracil-DNA glycosylase [Candidatus Cloacimonadota bacterium]MDD5624860.1 uracil-DNA glycosylase [Candidatus Cloacimonadota bacterium]MDY0111389.1 uracil-DNA glycosylase [Candidatus Syntrophosphaera sp.]
MIPYEIIQHLELLENLGINEIFLPPSPKAEILKELSIKYSNCTKCKLHTGRIKFVYGEGNPDALAMLIGEAPGVQENIYGRPFVGPAGNLLTNMLKAINLSREDVYICNIVKCRPPNNRNPEPEEREACLPYLLEQIEIIQPKLILMLGLVAAQTLLNTKLSMEKLRQTTHSFQGIKTFVTYHPSALLRNPNWKKPAWQDLQCFQAEYVKLLQ